MRKSTRAEGSESMSRIVESKTVKAFVMLSLPFLVFQPFTSAYASSTCGATITTDTTLTADLSGCTTNGLIIGAHNVTLDCQGHVISATGSFDGTAGILSQYIQNLTVRNCIIRNYSYGVHFFQTHHSQLVGNTLDKNYHGVFMENSDFNLLADNRATGGLGVGFVLGPSSNLIVRNNTADYNSEGFHLFGVSGSAVMRNTARSNLGGTGGGAGGGLSMVVSSGNVLYSNEIRNNAPWGLDFLNSHDNAIYNNLINNSFNARDDSYNRWNITKTPQRNIVGGLFIGGNFWSDYAGADINGDGLGDTLLPYNSGGNIIQGGDFLPLVMEVPAVPDFSVAANPTSVLVNVGATGNSTITVTSIGGFVGLVTLTASSSPATGLTCDLSQTRVTLGVSGTSTLSCSGTSGTYAVAVSATNGTRTRSTVVTLLVATYSDDFPAALSSYVYGGWQGPFGDGTAGRLFPTNDGTGIYMDATYNGFVWARRSSPEFADIDMTILFTIPSRDNTDADAFAFEILYHNPSTPPGGTCGTDCQFVTSQTGLKFHYRIGNSQLYVTHFANGIETILTQVTVPSVALNQAHRARALYSGGNLALYLDDVQLVNMQTPSVPAGELGFEAYRVDMIIDAITLTGTTAPTALTIPIDIKPGSVLNPINIKGMGGIPVAILSEPGFDASSQVVPSSLTFGRSGNEQSLVFCSLGPEDVNGDGLLDLICQFDTQTAGFRVGDAVGILRGRLIDGTAIEGTDSVRAFFPGDVNGDCIVDVTDLVGVTSVWHSTTLGLAADLNNDLLVDVTDLVLVTGHWHQTC